MFDRGEEKICGVFTEFPRRLWGSIYLLELITTFSCWPIQQKIPHDVYDVPISGLKRLGGPSFNHRPTQRSFVCLLLWSVWSVLDAVSSWRTTINDFPCLSLDSTTTASSLVFGRNGGHSNALSPIFSYLLFHTSIPLWDQHSHTSVCMKKRYWLLITPYIAIKWH